ncbi:MAG: glyceraldehyde 3-phosphate dehydrogenase [Parcubacteria group bacterium Athens0714_26]|nr:MAG: glyceraldehyde 3-phosphate dehydrogenase [Parcubacteria group bacterium Athens1014_26]TSD01178.1 MAG: glyceraldehyde 3-phosphate dehydrogenase [Parcubacteria group bacterium Athens0714_26]
MNKTTRIAINGFGRIGRLFLRAAFAKASAGQAGLNLDIVAINDLGDIENLAYLFKYDSVYRVFPGEVSVKKSDKNYLVVDDKEILIIQEKDPVKLPWAELKIDIVVEATGVFESFEKSKAHLDAGARRVVMTAPAKDDEGSAGGRTVLMGINENDLAKTNLTCNASCTTNATSPIIFILSENPGIQKAVLNTIHAYTNTQTTVDTLVKGSDFRRGRAAAQNIIPSTTGAAIAVTRVISDLKGKFDGIAVRVPVVTGSLIDLTFLAKRKTTPEEINDILRKAAATPRWENLIKVSDDQLVSSDIIGQSYATVVDSKFTKVIDGDLVKVLAWYDNEWGYVTTLVSHVLKAAETLYK